MNKSQINQIIQEYGNVFQAELGDKLNMLIEDGATIEEVREYLEKEQNVDGDIIIGEFDGRFLTAHGKVFEYADESYCDDSTGYNTVYEGYFKPASLGVMN